MSKFEKERFLYELLDTSDNKLVRASGRTTLLMNVYCQLLKDNVGKEFTIRDHFPTIMSDNLLAKQIKTKLEENDLYKVSIKENKLTLYKDSYE